MRQSRGMTILQLLLTLGIIAVLGTTAIPLCRTLLLEARMTSTVNALVHGFHAARQMAHKEARDVVLCRSTAGRQCAPSGDWSSGWIVFINRDADNPPMVDDDDSIVMVQPQSTGLSISSNRRSFVQRPYFIRATNGSFVVCDERGTGSARTVIVSYSGRPRVSRRNSAGGALPCPA